MTNLALYNTSNLAKSLIGFDQLFADVERIFSTNSQTNYPPFNILKTSEDSYIVEVAVTGFEKNEIDVKLDQGILHIKAQSVKTDDQETIKYLHRGLSTRNFEKQFSLADHMEVDKAVLANGMLRVYIKRVLPKELQPKTIAIQD